MMKEKIFKLHKHKSSLGNDVYAHRIDFTFSNLHAIQVPKGWDKLCLLIISSETGKTVWKSGKGTIKNGTCQWTETLSESIWISSVDGTKELEQYLVKFLVSTGSSRSGVLGEATLDLAAFISSEAPTLVSLPLKKCNHGTILQVETKCVTPKPNLRDEKWKNMHARKDDNADQDDMDNITEESDCNIIKSAESFSSNKFGGASLTRQLGVRETSFSSSVSLYSFDSMDDSVGRQSCSSQNNLNSANNIIGKQDPMDSHDAASFLSYSTFDSSKSDCSLQNSLVKENQSKFQRAFRKLSHSSSSSSEGTVQELKAESRKWEKNARKLAIDVENLRTELADQCLNTKNLDMELALSRSECQNLKKEIERLEFLVGESMKQNAAGNIELKDETWSHIQKEMGEEIRFQKESNESLSLQLEKTQKSNFELISILREMEETIEKQKLEIQSLSALKVSADKSKTIQDSDSEISMYETSVIDEQILLETNKFNLELELLNLQEVQKNLQSDLLYLESTLEEKIIETDFEQDIKNLILKEFEVECNCKLSEKDQKIVNLESSLSKKENRGHVDSSKELEWLKEKVQELEIDCNELTEENLELLFEVKELRISVSKDSNACGKILACKCMIPELNVDSLEKEKEIMALSFIKTDVDQLQEITEIIKRDGMTEPENNQAELEKHLSDLEEDNLYLSQRISGLEAQLRYLTETNESTRLELQHSESLIMTLQNETSRLEEEIEAKRLDMKQKFQEMQNPCSEAQEEYKSLSQVNIRLQATTEKLIEEYNLLDKFNRELREQKLKIQNDFMILEEEVRKHQHSLCNCSEYTNEGKCEAIIEELESKVKISELERIRLAEENLILHMQLAKVSELQNEVLDLRLSLKETKSQNQILESSFEFVSDDYEELKCASVSMVHKISSLQKEVAEVENCKRKKIALEDKILRLEGDLIARDAFCVLGTEMKNELNQSKRANSQLQMKVTQLEDLREDLQKKVQSLEEKLKQSVQPQYTNTTPVHLSKEEEECSVPMVHQRVLFSGSSQAVVFNKLESRETIDSTKKDHEISLLEAELQEIRERYLQISLKYAEVEGQKEQLVMKLKTLNS